MERTTTNVNKMQDLLDSYGKVAKTKKADGTARAYRSSLKKYLEYLDTVDVSIWDADESHYESFMMDKKDEGYSSSTAVKYDAGLALFYQSFRRMARKHAPDRIDPNRYRTPEEYPTSQIHPKTWSEWKTTTSRKKKELRGRDEYHSITPEQVDELANNVPDPILRNELIVRLLFHTGVRRTELSNIRIRDVNLSSREIEIDTLKSDENRTVTYGKSLDNMMNLWLNAGYRDGYPPAAESVYLFPGKKIRENIRPKDINIVVKAAAQAAGLADKPLYTSVDGREQWALTAHTLRHSYAVAAISPDVGERAIDLRNLQQLMGHESIDMTEKYLQTTDYVNAGHDCGPS